MAPAKVVIVMPAYNAERTLATVVGAIPPGVADHMIVVDDASDDRTAEVASRLPVDLLRHAGNRGYGANQKTCYEAALECGADFVVMLHPDGQYDARLIPAALTFLQHGVLDVVLGNRIRTRHEALAGGMPRFKYLANRGLTVVENVLAGQNLGEWHSGFRAYRRRVLESIPFHENADGFVFDSQFLLQCVHFGFRLGDIPMPVRYFEDMSTIDVSSASTYAVRTLWTFVIWYAHRMRVVESRLFIPRTAGEPAPRDAG